MKSFNLKARDIDSKWYVIDAQGKSFGRLLSKVATILRGKNKPTYTPHLPMGDKVIIINAKKVKLTGNKMDKMFYYWYSGYPGGLKKKSAREMLEKDVKKMFLKSLWGMLPKNKLGRKLLKNVRIYEGSEHPHAGQKPVKLDI